MAKSADVLKCELREAKGTRAMRRLRNEGRVPANLYGHGEGNVNLTVLAHDIEPLIRHGSHVVKLDGAVSTNALVREVQWDAFGVDVIHLDFTRVSADERVEVSVVVELRGLAPGVRQGGNVEHQLHNVEIECPAMSIPDRIEVNINELQLNESVLARDLELPESAKMLTDPDEIVVSCMEVIEEAAEEEEGMGEGGLEPEVITRKREEEEEGSTDD